MLSGDTDSQSDEVSLKSYHTSDESSDDESDIDPPSPKRPAYDDGCEVVAAATFDVAEVIGVTSSLDARGRCNLLTKHFKPCSNYCFPKTSTGRSFQHRWLEVFPWLVYSKKVNGGFCLPCVLFASCTVYHGSSPGVLVSRPLTSFKKALELLRKHATTEHHKTALVRADEFKRTITNPEINIAQRLNRAMADRISMNRQKLSSIMKTVELCGRQNIPLRGHRDSALDRERDVMGIENHGNFVALLNFRIDAGDAVLRDHLSTAARNATYTSNTIQNQIIQVLADQVRCHVINKVKEAKWFTVVADEVTDVANREQLSIVIRYVDSDTLLVREDLVGFFECDTGITGRSLADKIMSTLERFGLDLQYLRGQAYDGAGNMAGSVNGTAALITAKYPLALYLHCTSHCLNLAVVKSLGVTSVRNMLGVVGRVYQFFSAHPKRQRALEEAIDKGQPSSSSKKLKDMCRTRWIQRMDAANIFIQLYTCVVDCLENISNNGSRLWSSDSLTDAKGLCLAITNTEFVSALVITDACFKYIHPLTASLQAEAKDIVQAVSEVDNVIATLEDVRKHIDEQHSKWYLVVDKMCSDVGTVPSTPRRCGRQTHRSNVPADTPCEYYRRTISIPVLDHLVAELKTRFDNHQKTALLGLSLVPSLFVQSKDDPFSRVHKLAKQYECDLPSPECLDSELHSWMIKWQQHTKEHGLSSLPSSLILTLKHASSMFPNIRCLIQLLCTLPVTTCSAERSFSDLKRIETPLRSTMTNTRLTGLALLNVHRDIPIDIPKAIDEFARLYPRQLKMVDFLDDSVSETR